MAAHDGAVVPEEEMWPSPFSKDAAPGFKLEVPKKLTRGEKKRLNKVNREKVLKDEVMNVTDANDVFKMKNDVFRPSHSGPSPSKSPPSSDKEPEPEEKSKSKEKSESKGKSESERKKQRIMIKSDRCFVTINNCKIISD